MDFTIIKTQILNSRRTFRTPFKVTSMCFSPQNDLIALGSKSGDVMMKRTSWKMIWKTNVSMVPAVGTECKSESSVSALHFSPDGRFIAAATSKGLVHLLDVESGKIRYSVKAADDKITSLRWESVRENTFNTPFDDFEPEVKSMNMLESALDLAQATPDITREEIGFVYQRLDEDGSSFKHDDGQKENLERMIIPVETFNESLRQTILLACTDDSKITVLIAGVFPFKVIDVNEEIRAYDQDAIMFYDMYYNSAFGGVSFIVTTYGPYLDCKQEELKPPGNEPKSGQACHTLVFCVKLEIDPSLWDAALRYIRLLFGYNLYFISLETTKRNWTTQVAALHNRFDTKTKNVKIGDVLLEMLLSGSTDPAGEAFLERGLGTDGLEGVKAFAARHLPEVCRLARGQLASSARNLCFQLCEFMTALDRYFQCVQLKDDDSFLYDEDPPGIVLRRNAWLETLEEKINIIDMKTRQLGIQCLTMMQELGHLVKWISITKPFAKSMKVNTLMKMKRMKIEDILRYIVNNFIPDPETKKQIETRLFDLEKVMKEQKEKDIKEDFDELKYLEELEKKAEEERTDTVEMFSHKFEFSALSEDNFEEPPVLMKMEDSEQESENQPEPATESVSEPVPDATPDEPAQSVDLDRVGSFFERELSAKALEVLPECNDEFDDILNGRAQRMESDEIKKIGLMRGLEELAATLCSPEKLHIDKEGKAMKSKMMFVYEIASGTTHQGYLDAKFCNVASTSSKKHSFNDITGMRRSMQVTVIEKNLLNSVVIVPTRDIASQKHCEVTNHIEAMRRNYRFEKLDVKITGPGGLLATSDGNEVMEVDENELRIDVGVDDLNPQYDTLVEYNRIYPLCHGELVIVGKFSSRQESTGSLVRMMRSISSYPHQINEQKDVFAVQSANDGKTEMTIETMIVHPVTQLAAYLHEEGSKITIGDLKPEDPVPSVVPKKTNRKSFREYQRRRERFREDLGVGNLNDIQYDVLVQEAMDSGRDLTGPEEDDEEN